MEVQLQSWDIVLLLGLPGSQASCSAPILTLDLQHVVRRKKISWAKRYPKSRNVRRVGVGAEALLSSTSYATDKTQDFRIPQEFSSVVTPVVPEDIGESFRDMPPLAKLLKMSPQAVRALIHHIPLEDLRRLPATALLDGHLLDHRSIVLLTRRLGLPDLHADSKTPIGLALEPRDIIEALLAAAVSTVAPNEHDFMETFALRSCAHIEASWAAATSDPARDVLREQIALVFRVAARLGPPSSVGILRALIQHGVVDASLVPVLKTRTVAPQQLVLATLTRAANALEMHALAAELGGASALKFAETREAVRAFAKVAVLPDADPERVRKWMRHASRWSEYGCLQTVWKATRQRGVIPTGGAALGLLRYLLAEGHKGAARLLAGDVVHGEMGLQVGYRSAFIALCAEEGFAGSARHGWERYFGGEDAPALPAETDAPLDADGAQVPRMSLRLIALFLAIARSPTYSARVPDAHAFALRVFATLPREPRVEAHKVQVARAAFLLAGQARAAADATELRQHALTILRSTLDERQVPDVRYANVLLHELAQHDLSMAGSQLRHMRKLDIGPDGVALGSVAMKGLTRSLVRYGGTSLEGVRMLTAKGRRGVLRKTAESHELDESRISQAVENVGNPDLRRWWRQRKLAAAAAASP